MKISTYDQQALAFLKHTKAKLEIEFSHVGKHFDKDKEERSIHKITLSRGTRSYSFNFGQSLAKSFKWKVYGYKGPRQFRTDAEARNYSTNRGEWVENKDFGSVTEYDVLACLQKYDVGTFEDFCSEFGYDDQPLSEYPSVRATYEAVVKEYNAVQALFSDEELELLQEIQ